MVVTVCYRTTCVALEVFFQLYNYFYFFLTLHDYLMLKVGRDVSSSAWAYGKTIASKVLTEKIFFWSICLPFIPNAPSDFKNQSDHSRWGCSIFSRLWPCLYYSMISLPSDIISLIQM